MIYGINLILKRVGDLSRNSSFLLMTQFHTCNQHLPPDTAIAEKPTIFNYVIRISQLSKANVQAKKIKNRASGSEIHTFLSDTLPKRSKESLCTEISRSAGRDALVIQHESSETP